MTTDSRVCTTCDDPIALVDGSQLHYEHVRPPEFTHTAEPKLAHPMDTDPFAGIPGADNDEDTW